MRIGILASGGDGAGMNLCLYYLYKNLIKNNEIILFDGGYCGVVNNKTLNYDLKFLNSKKNDGGIVIKTSRCPEFMTQSGIQKAVNNLKNQKIDVVIVMGGNGSLKGAKTLMENNINVMFIPCTIDNDISESEYCIGFDTACTRCLEYINTVKDTMNSFNRICIYEVMGRECDQIAKKVGNNLNADYIYSSLNDSFEQCLNSIKKSKNISPIIILRENLINIEQLKMFLQQKLNKEIKSCVIGYFQRGGMPTKLECKNAKLFALTCAKNIKENNLNCQILVKNNNFIAKTIDL